MAKPHSKHQPLDLPGLRVGEPRPHDDVIARDSKSKSSSNPWSSMGTQIIIPQPHPVSEDNCEERGNAWPDVRAR